MNKITLASLILCCCISLTACGEKQQNTPKDDMPPTSNQSSTPSDSMEIKEKTPRQISMDSLVQESEYSKGKNYQFPHLNEETLGSAAKEFNQKIKETCELFKETYDTQENADFYKDLMKSVNYSAFLDEEKGWFSIVSHYIDPRGYDDTESLTLDLQNENHPIPFSTASQIYGFSEEIVLKKIEDYFKRLYVWDLKEHAFNTFIEEPPLFLSTNL